jgi:hypothetical protein
MKTKLVMRYDAGNRLLRVIRFTYNQGRNQFTLGLTPRLWNFVSEFESTIITILGVRMHFKGTKGGRFAD